MIIISISKRKLKLFAFALLAVLVVFIGANQIFGNQNTEKYKELVQALQQQEIAVSDEILTATSPAPESSNEIQIFDISKGKIVKKMKTGPTIQTEAGKIMNSITGLYAKVKPFPDKGYIVRVPCSPALIVQNNFINATVDKMYIIFTQNEPPIVLILDCKEKPFVYNFSNSTQELKKYLNFSFTY